MLDRINSGQEFSDKISTGFVIKNVSRNDDKFVVVTELYRAIPKSRSFKVPIGRLVTRPAEVGWYHIEIYRDGYPNPVRVDNFEVLSEKTKELDGEYYNGGCIITGE